MKLLVLDNYDSFTYNLVHAINKFLPVVTVKKNDEVTLEELEKYDKIVLSPGPGIPEESNMLKTIIDHFAPLKSIFGICLGQQAIAEVFGSELYNMKEVSHGVQSEIEVVREDLLFKNLPRQLKVGRYHSWVVSHDNFPDSLEVTSIGPRGEIMSLRHREYDVRGVQFHPESILTPRGEEIIKNWLES